MIQNRRVGIIVWFFVSTFIICMMISFFIMNSTRLGSKIDALFADETEQAAIEIYGQRFYDYRIDKLEVTNTALISEERAAYVILRLTSDHKNGIWMFDVWEDAFEKILPQHITKYSDDLVSTPRMDYKYNRDPYIQIYSTSVEQFKADQDKWVTVIDKTNLMFRENAEKLAKMRAEADAVFDSE